MGLNNPINNKNALQTALRRFAALMLLCAVLISTAGCRDAQTAGSSVRQSYSSFRDIPGITQEEIAAIEALQAEYDSFSYGMFPSTEAFMQQDGTIGGYSALICGWLTELFGIPFNVELYAANELFVKLDEGEIDFSGTIMPSEQRENAYFMTDTIAERQFVTIRLKDSPEISRISIPRYAVAANTPLIDTIASMLQEGTYEIVPAASVLDAYDMLRDGKADAYVAANISESVFIGHDDVIIEDFYPLAFNPASMGASRLRPELEAVISVVNKALQEDSTTLHLLDLYKQGYRDYRKFAVMASLTPDELAFIRDNPVVPVAAYTVNYPLCFYNDRENEWQGYYFELLDEVTALTGITFVVGHERSDLWPDVSERLVRGEFALVPERQLNAENEEHFVFSQTVAMEDEYALVSHTDYPDITLNEIPHIHIGIAATTHGRVFRGWFPNHTNLTEYVDIETAFAALQNGEVDMVLTTQRRLMYLTHYEEQVDYKANVIFNQPIMTRLAAHKDYEVLLNIIDKALNPVEVDRIISGWSQRTYDYRARIAEAQLPWMIGSTLLTLFVLVLVIFIFYRNRRAAQRATRRLQTILDTLPVGIRIMRLDDFTLLYSNKVCMDIFGCTSFEEQVEGQSGFGFMPEYQPDGRTTQEFIDDMFKSGNPVSEFQCLRLDGTPFMCRATTCTIDYDGRPASLAAMEDITAELEYRQMLINAAAKEQEANQLKSRFLATMSHEIRTPMNTIMGMTELALRESDAAAKDERISAIKKAGAILLTIINDILDFSKIEAGKMDIVPEYYLLDSLLGDVAGIISVRASESGLDFTVGTDSKIPRTLYGDEARIRQALLNLLGNAVKYTESGHVSLDVTGEITGKDTMELILKVSDTGIGIRPEDIDKLFTDFTQLDVEKRKSAEGVGLGLAITQRIIEAMGGSISVESEYGKGSTFTVRITQKYSNYKSEVPSGAGGTQSGVFTGEFYAPEAKVLIVDDMMSNLKVAEGLLMPYKMSVDLADSGAAAIEAVQRERYDLIFMDHKMPGTDGIEATKQIRKLGKASHGEALNDPYYKTLPIIALTANAVSGMMEMFIENGFSDFLAKPIDTVMLNTILEKWIPKDKQQYK